MNKIELTPRQEKIIAIVKDNEPITGEQIAERLSLTRAAIRADLAILTMSHILEAKPRVGYFFSGRRVNYLVGEQIRKMKVNEIKSVPVVIQENTSVYDAIVMLFLEDVGTLFVVREGGILEGVVSRKDLLKATLGNADIHQMPVSIIMTRMPNIVMINPDETVYEAAKKIVDKEVDSLPVVRLLSPDNEKGGQRREEFEVIGRITKTSITRLLVELAEIR